MTWPTDALRLSAELRDELARSEARRKRVDPRTVPLRFHHLKAMGRSAAHCYESFQGDGEQTLAMRLGSGAHALLLGTPVALWDQPAKNGKGGKAPRSGEAWASFSAQHQGKTILNRKEYDQAMRIVAAIHNSREACEILSEDGAQLEQTILWEQNKRTRRSTPDIRAPRRVTELKVTRDASPGAFRWDVKRRCYHAQLVDQRNAARATGDDPLELCIIAVESTAPHVVQVYRLTPRDVELGEQILGSWLAAYQVAEDSNAWDGYAYGILDLEVPDDSDDEIVVPDDDEPEVEASDEDF